MLSYQSYTSAALWQKMAQKSGEDAANLAVERMKEIGLVDDESYALQYAAELYNRKLFAPRRIKHELAKRGIDKELCDLAIESLDCEDALFDNAVRLVEKMVGAICNETARQKAVSLL